MFHSGLNCEKMNHCIQILWTEYVYAVHNRFDDEYEYWVLTRDVLTHTGCAYRSR